MNQDGKQKAKSRWEADQDGQHLTLVVSSRLGNSQDLRSLLPDLGDLKLKLGGTLGDS